MLNTRIRSKYESARHYLAVKYGWDTDLYYLTAASLQFSLNKQCYCVGNLRKAD